MQPAESPDDLTAPLRDAVALLDELSIEHAVVGGVAAMIHGRARYTDDVDLIAAPDHEAKLAANPEAMQHWRFDLLRVVAGTATEVAAPGDMFQNIRESRELRPRGSLV